MIGTPSPLTRRGAFVVPLAMLSLALGGTRAEAQVTPVTSDAAGATTVAQALAAEPTGITATFDTIPSGAPAATVSGFAGFPTDGTSAAMLTSGAAADAILPQSDGASTALGGGPVRGGNEHDVTVLRIPINVPAGANCLALDFRFLSEEFPDFVGSTVNDAFVAELDASTWSTTFDGAVIAPGNFAFDPRGSAVSVNSSFADATSGAEAAGTVYGGATPILEAKTQVTPGAHVLFLSLFDQGDGILDSAAIIDRLRFTTVANPETACARGATQNRYSLALTPAAASAPQGMSQAASATVTRDGAPIGGQTVSFTVSGANSTSGTATTDGSGVATFSYTGANAGVDTVTACVDANGNGSCGDVGDAVGSVRRVFTPDVDRDGRLDSADNCPSNANVDQADADADGIGDPCDASNGSAAPVLGSTATARVVSGTVLIQRGGRFVPLKGAETIPMGSTLDTTKGTVEVSTASGVKGATGASRTKKATLADAIFAIRQKRAKETAKGVPADIVLKGQSFPKSCTPTKKKPATPKKRTVFRSLKGLAAGYWRTVARGATLTVQNASWTVQDRCDGTLTKVTKGSVSVRDSSRKRTVRVKAGKSYLAQIFVAKQRARRS